MTVAKDRHINQWDRTESIKKFLHLWSSALCYKSAQIIQQGKEYFQHIVWDNSIIKWKKKKANQKKTCKSLPHKIHKY